MHALVRFKIPYYYYYYYYLDLNCHSIKMHAPPPLATLADAAVASGGTCHCYQEWHYFLFVV